MSSPAERTGVCAVQGLLHRLYAARVGQVSAEGMHERLRPISSEEPRHGRPRQPRGSAHGQMGERRNRPLAIARRRRNLWWHASPQVCRADRKAPREEPQPSSMDKPIAVALVGRVVGLQTCRELWFTHRPGVGPWATAPMSPRMSPKPCPPQRSVVPSSGSSCVQRTRAQFDSHGSHP